MQCFMSVQREEVFYEYIKLLLTSSVLCIRPCMATHYAQSRFTFNFFKCIFCYLLFKATHYAQSRITFNFFDVLFVMYYLWLCTVRRAVLHYLFCVIFEFFVMCYLWQRTVRRAVLHLVNVRSHIDNTHTSNALATHSYCIQSMYGHYSKQLDPQLFDGLPIAYVCVFITAGPIIKLCAGGEGDSEGHVL